MIILYLITTFIISSIFNISKIPYLYPNIFIISIPLLYLLSKNKKIYMILIIILTIFYDLIFSKIFGAFFMICLLFIFITIYFYNKNKPTIINFIILEILFITLYHLITFIIYKVSLNINLSSNSIIYITNYYLLNIIYALIWYFLYKKVEKIR